MAGSSNTLESLRQTSWEELMELFQHMIQLWDL